MYVYKAASVKDLIERCTSLSLTDRSGEWNFRGQANSSWTLLPSLLRPSSNYETSIPNPRDFENRVLEHLKRVLRERTTFSARMLMDEDTLLAIAQHYSVKTRMLDWTHDLEVALYFACSNAIRLPPVDSVSVFAMAEFYLNDPSVKKAQVVRPPRAANPNLAAQRGLLTKHEWDDSDLWDPKREEPTNDPEKTLATRRLDARLVRFDLPYRCVIEGMRLLLKRGIDASTLFPTEYGLARYAEDQTLIDLLVTKPPPR